MSPSHLDGIWSAECIGGEEGEEEEAEEKEKEEEALGSIYRLQCPDIYRRLHIVVPNVRYVLSDMLTV